MAARDDIVTFCAGFLAVDEFRDAAINGLQVEGRRSVERIAVAVSASQHTIEAALAWGADALLVHHGLLWGERLGPIVGPLRYRLKGLLAADLNLLAYHLPLDAHSEIGNNARLAAALGLNVVDRCAEVHGQPIGVIATPAEPTALTEIVARLAGVTEREPLVLAGGPPLVGRVAIVSGSGYAALDEAAAAGCDALLTGDVRESTMALARELGVTVVAGGHEATERLGVQALAEVLEQEFGVETRFLPDPNPV
ncbi:MAG: Nif3-like dinuclear metal center hexameric protein [Sphaerobacter sp.]|nr:Nif3-like dinuclear metal center hexameric protein [Sphaerobacter sp.]